MRPVRRKRKKMKQQNIVLNEQNGVRLDVFLKEKNEEVYKENQPNPIILSRNDFSLQLLQRVRDEAHRYAITFHRNLRTKNGFKSSLLEIENIGEKKAKILFNNFKTIENISNATIEDLTSIKGITKKDAVNIIKYFMQ